MNQTTKYCEVYDEPRHRFHLRNAFVNVYEIELPQDQETLFHRHTQDTVYFVIADAEVRESFLDKPPKITTAAAGGTMCRAHKDEHLIHQVSNVGRGTMHMVGAEALALPPVVSAVPLVTSSHKLNWDSNRFRVYDVALDAAQTIDYPCYGLLMSFVETNAAIMQDNDPRRVDTGLRAGSYLWLEAGQAIALEAGFRGIFAEWI